MTPKLPGAIAEKVLGYLNDLVLQLSWQERMSFFGVKPPDVLGSGIHALILPFYIRDLLPSTTINLVKVVARYSTVIGETSHESFPSGAFKCHPCISGFLFFSPLTYNPPFWIAPWDRCTCTYFRPRPFLSWLTLYYFLSNANYCITDVQSFTYADIVHIWCLFTALVRA
ncbi:hypothetical protein BDZ97DRAFT_1780165 [Flammula alnicola]|nr:hypothetical protein BDZ97DRAFT_1780165 [Flammula alnicola]